VADYTLYTDPSVAGERFDAQTASMVTDPASATQAALNGAYVAKPGSRNSFMVLNAPVSTGGPAATDYAYRTVVRLPVTTARWRIGFANRNLRSATTLTSPCTITGVYMGTPVYGTTGTTGARWEGAATGAMTQVATSFAMPTDGTVGWSAWIEAGANQFQPFTEKVIGWGQTTANSGNGFGYTSTSYQAYRASGQSANAGNATLTGVAATTQIYFDIFIEYELVTAGQVGLFIGDSNTAGVTTSPPSLFPSAGTGGLAHESWPSVAGELGTFAAINLGVGSAELVDFATTYPGLWTRVDLTAINIDFAVVSLGTNGLSSSPGNFTNSVTYIRAINTKLRTLGIKRIYWTDITPRGLTASVTPLTAGMSAGATTFQTGATLTFDDGQSQVVIGTDTSAEYLAVTSTTPTGSGPYTYTLTSACANAHVTGELVSGGKEAARRRLNAFWRNLPDGISGVIGFEQAFEASPLSALSDPRLVCADGLHFQRGAAMQRAAQTVIAGVAPKLS
jgi:hypothetical protein